MSDSSISMEPQWAAFAAIDWGNQKHVWILQPAAGGKRETGELPNTPEAIAVWAMQLDQLFGGRPIALALEQKRGAVVNMLLKYRQLVLYPVPPAMSAALLVGPMPARVGAGTALPFHPGHSTARRLLRRAAM